MLNLIALLGWYPYSIVFSTGLQFRVAHNIADSREVQLHARFETENDLVLACTDELALLRMHARLGAMKSLSALRI